MQRRLAGAVGPHHGDQLAGSGVEGQAVQGRDPVGIGVVDRVGFDRQGAGRVGHKGHLSASRKAKPISHGGRRQRQVVASRQRRQVGQRQRALVAAGDHGLVGPLGLVDGAQHHDAGQAAQRSSRAAVSGVAQPHLLGREHAGGLFDEGEDRPHHEHGDFDPGAGQPGPAQGGEDFVDLREGAQDDDRADRAQARGRRSAPRRQALAADDQPPGPQRQRGQRTWCRSSMPAGGRRRPRFPAGRSGGRSSPAAAPEGRQHAQADTPAWPAAARRASRRRRPGWPRRPRSA